MNAFSWTNIEEESRDSVAAALRAIPNDELNPVAQMKRYSALCYYNYTYKKDFVRSLLYADSLIGVAEADPDHYITDVALGYNAKADILFALGNYDEAYKNYYAARKILNTKKDNCSNSDYSYRIGMVLYRQAKFSDARSFFQKGFEESLSCVQDFPIVYREQELLNNIALSFSKGGNIDSAIAYYHKALSFIDKNDTIALRKLAFNSARGVVYGNLGEEFIKKKKYKEAEDLLLKSIAINTLPKYDNNDAVLTQIKLGNLYLQTKALPKATKLIENLKLDVDKVKNEEATTRYYQLAAAYHEQMGETQKAFQYLSTYVRMKDTAQSRFNRLNKTDIYERFKNLDSQTEINFLKREKQIKDVYLFGAIIFLLMTIAIILLIYFYWRKSKRNVKVLTQLNDQISAQKLQLEETLNHLEHSNQEKDSLLRAVAHDLRNPIGGISSLVSLMLEEDTDEELKKQHVLIKEACLNVLELINELIEASENHNQVKVDEKRIAVNIHQLVSNTIELLRFKAQEKHQSVHLEALNDEVLVEVNPEKILRVISNLISNAIKFSNENTQINIHLSVEGKEVKIGVADNGIGILPKHADQIFQMYTPAKRAGTHGEKSYGLGLSISKQIINAHGGKIWFEPNPLGGTVFYFSLPIR